MPIQVRKQKMKDLLFSLQLMQHPSNRQLSCAKLPVRQGQEKCSVERAIDMMEMFAYSEDEVDADITICAQPSEESGKI